MRKTVSPGSLGNFRCTLFAAGPRRPRRYHESSCTCAKNRQEIHRNPSFKNAAGQIYLNNTPTAAKKKSHTKAWIQSNGIAPA
jgi:hypothetical protein